jgi:hypothetical protein
MASLEWKDNWDRTRERLAAWWRREGLALCITSPNETPIHGIPAPPPVADVRARWTDPELRCHRAEYEMSRTYYGGESFPYFDTEMGPGNLATFIGSDPSYEENTVWYNPCITDPDSFPPLRFRADNHNYRTQVAIIEKGLAESRGRYLVGIPDLVENMDILVSLRGMEPLLADMIDRPAFVEERIAQINRIYFKVYDLIREKVKDPWGGNAFSAFRIWGAGRTAKLQCDVSAAISPAMFHRFVVHALTEQCKWLDNSLYHLDGTQCICHLEELFAINELDAIEWTPQAGRPSGGSPEWFDLYRRILASGKGLQVVGAEPKEVIPLLDAVGAKGLFVIVRAETEQEARELEAKVDRYR